MRGINRFQIRLNYENVPLPQLLPFKQLQPPWGPSNHWNCEGSISKLFQTAFGKTNWLCIPFWTLLYKSKDSYHSLLFTSRTNNKKKHIFLAEFIIKGAHEEQWLTFRRKSQKIMLRTFGILFLLFSFDIIDATACKMTKNWQQISQFMIHFELDRLYQINRYLQLKNVSGVV